MAMSIDDGTAAGSSSRPRCNSSAGGEIFASFLLFARATLLNLTVLLSCLVEVATDDNGDDTDDAFGKVEVNFFIEQISDSTNQG